MWHATYMQVNQSDSWLLVIGSQIEILTLSLSLSHNLCFKYSNGSCNPILDICISKSFQWHKEVFNLMSFDPWNHSLKIQDSIGIPTPKGVHLGMCGFIPSHTPSHSQECKCESHVALLARTFPCLCFGRKPKVRVVTKRLKNIQNVWI